jgi:iron complex transport system ATP-binding protein
MLKSFNAIFLFALYTRSTMRLCANGVTAGYGEADVLHQISITFESGEFVGLVGPNGCGKSTLLRALSRTLRPSSGTVALDDASIWTMTPIELARKMAFVPQQEPAFFDFTVRDVVMMGRYPHRNGRTSYEADSAAVTKALDNADITALAERPITRLSGGEHRRVLLGRALAQDTPLMLLDEPTAHLDVTHQAELLTLVQRLTRLQGVGALAALHELNSAAEYCDRLILMCEGRVVTGGSPQEVLTPENLRIAYNARARVGRNPVSGRPMILSLTSVREETGSGDGSLVHLVCGGGSGIHLFHALLRHGYSVTAGVLNENDSDCETAEALGIDTAVESPFSPISPEAQAAARTMMLNAAVILIADVPFGAGNIANLELAVEAHRNGKPVVMIDCGDAEQRDYTGGHAAELIRGLLNRGANHFESVEAWLSESQASR